MIGTAVSVLIAIVGWCWALFQYFDARRQRRPYIVFEMKPDERRKRRWHGSVTVRNRGGADIYVTEISLDRPQMMMFVDDGGPLWFPGEDLEKRRKKTGRKIGLPPLVFMVVQMTSSYIGPHIFMVRMSWLDSSVGMVYPPAAPEPPVVVCMRASFGAAPA